MHGRGVEDLLSLVRGISVLQPAEFASEAVAAIRLADALGHLSELESSGFFSQLASSASGDVMRALAFAYWRLGNWTAAGQLQTRSLLLPMSTETVADLGDRVRSAIERYRAAGDAQSCLLAWRLFEDLKVDSSDFRVLASEFVLAMDAHSQLTSGISDAVRGLLENARPEQTIFRLIAFLWWRRGDSALAAQWDERAARAPNLVWPGARLHSLALRENARPDLFRR